MDLLIQNPCSQSELSVHTRFICVAETAVADRLLDWITAQALSNHGMIAELHSPDSSTYEGEIPMVGFGAGAYLLALLERQSPRPVEPACLSWESQ